MRSCRTLFALCVSASVLLPTKTVGQRTPGVLTIGNMTGQEIAELSRDSTLFILSVGMLEWHGPHLPIAADQIGVEYEAQRVANRLSSALPGWNVVMMPTLSYGSSGANQITGTMHVHPGTYGVRQSTLRSIIADIGGQIAQNGFKWIFVLNGHGAPTHHIAVNEAADFISETFNVTMLNVSGLFAADSAIQARGRALAVTHFSAQQIASFGLDVHAGVSETSGILAIQPELVRAEYRSLPPNVGRAPLELRALAMRPGWQGYFSSPASATAAYGRDIENWWIEGTSDLVLAAVRGANLFGRPRAPVVLVQPIIEGILAPERDFQAKLERWLATRRARMD